MPEVRVRAEPPVSGPWPGWPVVPLTAAILATPRAGPVAASLFCGCGGSSLGLRWAGLDVRYANEFHPNAAACYELNFGRRPDARDVRAVRGAEILEACGGRVDVLDASPPCQSFSMAGKRQKGWGAKKMHSDGTRQRSDDLFLEFCRLVEEAKPRSFMAENVPGLAAGTAWGFLREVCARLRRAGYEVRAKILDASWLGVPQSRRRLWLVGTRLAERRPPEFPRPWRRRTRMIDALPRAAEAKFNSNGIHKKVARGKRSQMSAMTASRSDHFSVCAPPVTSFLARESLRVAPGRGHKKHFNLRLASPGSPAPTMAAMWGRGNLAQVMPSPWRRFEIWELRRLMGFPDDFQLEGSYAEQWARLGNAVPPPMAAAVAAALSGCLRA